MQKPLIWQVREKNILGDNNSRRTVGIITFLILTVAGAFVYIPLPITPVPITLQTFFVMLCAAFLKRKDGIITQSVYLGLGAMGIPIFTGATGGLIRLFGPTGGYLVGFAAAIYVISSLLDYYRSKGQLNFMKILIAFTSGMITIYLCGGLWLAFITKFSFMQIVNLGVLPFVGGDAIKVICAAIIFHKANKRTRNLFKA